MDWPVPTLPLVTVAYKGPAYTDSAKDTAALAALAFLAFSPTSELYQKLVVQEQKADSLDASAPENVDPALFQITARVKKAADLEYVRDRILAAVQGFRDKPVDAARLDGVRRHLRYAAALRMDSSDAVAAGLARYVALRRTPESMNKLFDQFAQLTPEDIQQAAAKYLAEEGRTIVTLTGPRASAPEAGQ